LKIAYITPYDPENRRAWSGLVYYMAQALQKHCGDVSYLGPVYLVEELAGKILNRSMQFLAKKRFPHYISFLLARRYASIFAKRLAKQEFDVIIAPSGVTSIAFLNTEIPIVLVEDATFALLYNYYPNYTALPERSRVEAETVTQLAIEQAHLVIFSSYWAAQSAIEDYRAEREKVHVIPFGANFEDLPGREVTLAKKKGECCKLLFVGVKWEGKGGDIAFETLEKLEEMGVAAELIVCGCTPPGRLIHKNMKVIPFLDKNQAAQRRQLKQLYMMCNFLLLPTRYDCTPIVFSEASAFGLPIITARTGGVSEIVRDGENGFVLPYEAKGAEYAEVIARVYREEQEYEALVRSSRATFEERLNWDTWGRAMKELLTKQISLNGAKERNKKENSAAR